MRTTIFAGLLSLASSLAYGQVPPPVPPLPDSQRLTSYTFNDSRCACAVNFALYGDATDYQNWIEVWLNGVNVAFNDPASGWSISSPSGSLASIPRPITNAVLNFNTIQSGTVQIVGARRPRRASQFQENQGVTARNYNQVLTDLMAQSRERWDKSNDATGRMILSQPGNTLGPLPPPSACANKVLAFDATGTNFVCINPP